jgi:hypothetical protein
VSGVNTDSALASAAAADVVAANRERLSRSGVIAWWEWRRVPFNVVLLIVGVFSCVAAMLLLSGSVQPGEDLVEPAFMLFNVVLYAIAANAFYALGWVVELIVRRFDPEAARRSAEVMFRWGLLGSCVLTAAPLWFALIFRAAALLKKP